jgi:Protein of unknown function (DUF2723)
MGSRRKSKQKRTRESAEREVRTAPRRRRPRRGQAGVPSPPAERAPAEGTTRAPSPPPAGGTREWLERRGLDLAAEPAAISRADVGWAAGVAGLSAVLFATTLPGHPALGDAPETVAGVSSLGILHAPGYPAYVVAAWLFTTLIPFGSFAWQVNLFSLVCAALMIGGTYLLARRLGAARWASALGALALATGGAFWFYADFAKHDMFSGLTVVVAVNLLLAWQAKPSIGKLAALGATVGVGFASSWALMSLVLPAIGLMLLLERRRISLVGLATVALAGVATAAAFYCFVMIRAAQDPEVNWGDADTPAEVASLFNRADFRLEGKQPRSGFEVEDAETLSGPPIESRLSHTVKAMGVDLAILYEELGVAAIVLAALGLGVSLWRGRGPPAYALLAVFLVNLVGAAFVAGSGSFQGVDTALFREGFVLGSLVVGAAWVGLGASSVTGYAARALARRERSADERAALGLLAVPVLCLAVLLPSVLMHADVPARASEPWADRFAESVFAELPEGAVIFIFGAERTQPLVYRQVVADERPDVTVVAADAVGLDWYREDLSERLGMALPPSGGTIEADAAGLIRFVSRDRPVFMDFRTAQILHRDLRFRPIGFLARPAAAERPLADRPLARFEQRVRAAAAAAGMPDADWDAWPAEYFLDIYTSAAHEVSRAYFRRDDAAGLRRSLRYILYIDPENTLARRNLFILNTQGLPG